MAAIVEENRAEKEWFGAKATESGDCRCIWSGAFAIRQLADAFVAKVEFCGKGPLLLAPRLRAGGPVRLFPTRNPLPRIAVAVS
jgi:hypothetical protein